MEAKFPIADDELSIASVARTPPTKIPLGPAIECRQKKILLFNDEYTNKENTVPSKANIAAIDISKKRKAVGRPLPTMESRLSKPPDDNVDVEFQNQNDNSSKNGDGEQSSQAEMPVKTPVKSTPVNTTISNKQQNGNSSEDGEIQNQFDDSREDGGENSNLFNDSSKDGDGEQSSQAETPVKTPVKRAISTK